MEPDSEKSSVLSDRLSKGAISLSVGITGHRPNKLLNTAIPKVSAELGYLLDDIASAASAGTAVNQCLSESSETRLLFVSCLAEGSDRIAAQVALRRGYRLAAVLPFSPDNYRYDFENEGSRNEFDGLLNQASFVVELPGRRTEKPLAYEKAGLEMLKRADILIAVWDGKEEAGRGGTKTVIDAAIRDGLPVIIIDANAEKAPEIHWSEFHGHSLGDLGLNSCLGGMGKIKRVIKHLVAQKIDDVRTRALNR